MNPNRRPLSPLELQLAEQLVQSRLQAVALTAFGRVDLGPLMDLHAQVGEAFRLKYGTALGLLPFLVKAAARALEQTPRMMGRLDGGDWVTADSADLAVEISTPAGRFQPVLRGCAHAPVAELAADLADLAERAAGGSLTIPDLQGGVLTLIAHGPEGPECSTPALGGGPGAVLAIHPARHQPAACGGSITIRPVAKLALSHDARTVTTTDAAAFLAAFRDALQTPVGLLLDA
jgi:2-oxoglutarate dehydrogenase E2 component (dihydrolipoamide succinyltransferase)